jgi:osmotically inducible protein OsmC
MVDQKASAIWEGELFSGKGTVSLDSSHAAGPLDVSWASRAESPGAMTSPEELIAAAHSACYSMALSNTLNKAGTPPTRLDTSAVVSFEKGDAGFGITRVALTVRGDVPGADDASFRDAAEQAKTGCPVSKALAGNVDITVDAALA